MDIILVESVKNYLGITTDDVDVTKNIFIKASAVKRYLIKAGATIESADYSEEVIACIATGVNDLLNNKAGDTKFSPAFNMLAMQICRG
ncbi:hypothetical protein PMY73_07060 [Clostridium tertium]|uniref:hypothetical protein n=1 Tax=Clostridium tertium TaxID=1559 RepID=UPI00232F145B|nr:hypothetical protein [Clostridium tertium]MDB1943738.1 hypothetical protein [Clostridium tertium]MDB1951096.1 hypothetical protein [Clostridium tertium]